MTAPRATDHAVERLGERFGLHGTKAELEAVLAEIPAVRAGAAIHGDTEHVWTVVMRQHDIALHFKGPVLVTVTIASQRKHHMRRKKSLSRCQKPRFTNGRKKRGLRRPECQHVDMED